MDNWRLRLLDPATDRNLFVTAYNWRRPKRHLFGPRIDFETFTDTQAAHLTFGLFNGELLAVYFFRETSPSHFESHFTSRKGTPRDWLVRGARVVTDLCLANGASEMYGVMLAENKPLRQFVTEVGMRRIATVQFLHCAELDDSSTMPTRNHRTFLKYAKRA